MKTNPDHQTDVYKSDVYKSALEKALKRGQQQLKKKADQLANKNKSKIQQWEERRQKKQTKEKITRRKSGIAIAESFIQETAEAFTRLATRNDANKMDGLKIIFIPGKSDFAPRYSACIMHNAKRELTFYTANIEQLVDRDERLISKLRKQTNFAGSTPQEMLEEIARLQSKFEQQEKDLKQCNAVASAAQKVYLAWTDNEDFSSHMSNLEKAFLKPNE